MLCLPLLGMLLLSAACFCEYCCADRRAAGVGVSAAFFMGVLEGFFIQISVLCFINLSLLVI